MNKIKLTILVILVSIVFSCRTKVKTIDKITVDKVEQVKSGSVVESKSNVDKEIKQNEIKKIVKDESSNNGDVEIKGKSDTIKGFTYHNIQGGDTLQSISILGNADFVIKNKWNNSKIKENSNIASESLNKVAEFSRKAVSRKTIKNAALDFKKVENKVSVHSSSFGMVVFYTIICIIIIAAIWLFYYLGGKIEWKQLFSKFVKNK